MAGVGERARAIRGLAPSAVLLCQALETNMCTERGVGFRPALMGVVGSALGPAGSVNVLAIEVWMTEWGVWSGGRFGSQDG